jgi:hypothetical protein
VAVFLKAVESQRALAVALGMERTPRAVNFPQRLAEALARKTEDERRADAARPVEGRP